MKKVTIEEIVNLIHIRNYASNSVNNHSIKRDTVNQLNVMVILLDKMLIEKLTSDDFKQLIDYDQAGEVVKEVARTTNIKAGMNATNKIVTIEDGKAEVK